MDGWTDILLQRGNGAGPAGFTGIYGILGLIVLVLDILVIVWVVRSGKPLLTKIVWILVILFLPILGLVLYVLLGRGK